jgi:hypothetical protein
VSKQEPLPGTCFISCIAWATTHAGGLDQFAAALPGNASSLCAFNTSGNSLQGSVSDLSAMKMFKG